MCDAGAHIRLGQGAVSSLGFWPVGVKLTFDLHVNVKSPIEQLIVDSLGNGLFKLKYGCSLLLRDKIALHLLLDLLFAVPLSNIEDGVDFGAGVVS